MAEKSSLLISRVAWVSASDMGIVGNYESVISAILHGVHDSWPLEVLGNWRQLLSLQVLLVLLLVHEILHPGTNLLTDLHSLGIGVLWVESGGHHGLNELGSLFANEDSRVIVLLRDE